MPDAVCIGTIGKNYQQRLGVHIALGIGGLIAPRDATEPFFGKIDPACMPSLQQVGKSIVRNR